MDSMNRISIERASPEQAEQLSVIAFAAKAYWGYPERWMELWRPQLTFNSDYIEANETWVAYSEQGPIGFYTLQDKDGNAWVEDLWVLPEWIGKGIGRQLFSHAAALARQLGYKRLQLVADPNAAGFYEKMGMYKIGERYSEVDGQPRILPIMETQL
jgi:GNAT superfamily N-acetyltransferase